MINRKHNKLYSGKKNTNKRTSKQRIAHKQNSHSRESSEMKPGSWGTLFHYCGNIQDSLGMFRESYFSSPLYTNTLYHEISLAVPDC